MSVIDARVVDSGDDARRLVLELIPEGAEVHSGKSKTLQDIGLFHELFESGRYESLRARSLKIDRQTQGREMRKLLFAPDYMLGSVLALTEAGDLVVASASASQIIRREWVDGRLTVIIVRAGGRLSKALSPALPQRGGVQDRFAMIGRLAS